MKNRSSVTMAVWSLLGAGGAAWAQSGTLDQTSPTPTGASSAGYNLSAAFLVWQQQARAGIAGTLEGVRLTFTGPIGAQAFVRIRGTGAWSTDPVLFSTLVTKTTATTEVVFVNTSGAGIALAVGQAFVIETQGNDTGMGLNGSYIAPPGAPLYAEPLFLTGSNFADGGWRHGFQTFMLTGPVPCYANCDESTTAPVLNVADFGCFLGRYAAGEAYANCDGSTTAPVLNVADFGCFLGKYAAGCP